MIQCQNCGQINSHNSNFCRFCGTKFGAQQFANGNNFANKGVNNYEFTPPRPYVWKTDEFQISEAKARKSQHIKQVQPINNLNFQSPPPMPLVPQQHQQNIAYNYRCPRCASQLYPRFERKISVAGWIVFAVLLVTFFPLFWVGFLIKEDVRVCPVCQLKMGQSTIV